MEELTPAEQLDDWDRQRRLSAEKSHADWNAELRKKAKDATIVLDALLPPPRELDRWHVVRAYRRDMAGVPVLGFDVRGVDGFGHVVTGIARKHDGGPVWVSVRCSDHGSRHTPGTVESMACRLDISESSFHRVVTRLGMTPWPPGDDGATPA